jgi:serine-type D-Ala-D-Ala carboxypeptidase/endopeptidase (penicillin-binding protein 4)
VLRPLNKTSDNALSRLLFLQLGVPAMASDPLATTQALAEREVRRWLAENQINDAGLVLDNGSGLSRSERITPWQLAQMLAVAHRSRYASDLMMSLPTVGVDGSMRNRLKDSPATGWARLKTGTLKNVTALAGYVTDPQGRPWAVAMMLNHEDAAKARPALDALVDSFARLGPHGALRRAQR